MQLTESVKKSIEKAVRVSMQIEGYRLPDNSELQQKIKRLMELNNVKVSIPTK
jgi:hypothetical protein